MLSAIAVILCVLWALGLLTSFTMGGFIHILLYLALVIIVIRLFQGRPATGEGCLGNPPAATQQATGGPDQDS